MAFRMLKRPVLPQDFKARALQWLALVARGRIFAEADPTQVEVAKGYIREGISLAEKIKAKPFTVHGYLFLGEVLEIASRREEALESLKKDEEMYLEMKVATDSYWLNRAREALARLQHTS